MKITKQQLKQINKEELADASVDEPLGAPDRITALEGMRGIEEIVQLAQMNKSFGFSPNITNEVIEQIRSILDAIDINELPKGI